MILLMQLGSVLQAEMEHMFYQVLLMGDCVFSENKVSIQARLLVGFILVGWMRCSRFALSPSTVLCKLVFAVLVDILL